MSREFKTDEDGNIILFPVIAWTTGTVAEVGILLVIDYAETPADVEAGGQSIQFVLTVPQTLQLSEKLTSLANGLLDPGDQIH